MKFCHNCGTPLEDDAKFCLSCGTPVQVKEKPAPKPVDEAEKEPVYADEAEPAPAPAPEPAPAPAPAPASAPAPAPAYEDDDKEPTYADEEYEAPANANAQPAAPIMTEEKKAEIKEKVRKLPWKKIGIICAAVLVVAILIPIIVSIVKKANPPITFGAGGLPYLNDYNDTLYIGDEKGGVTKVEDVRTHFETFDLKHEKAIIEVRSSNGDKTLNYYDGKALKKITDDEFNDSVITMDGSKVIYVKPSSDDSYSYNMGDIYAWEDGKSTKIVSSAALSAVSPDGKIIGYYTVNDEGAKTGYIYDGKEKEIGKNYVPFAVSSGAKYVYLYRSTDEGTALYVQSGTNENSRNKLTGSNNVSYVYFNKAMNEIMYTSDGKTYLSVKGKEAEKISSKSLEPMIHARVASYRAGKAITLSIDSFNKKIYRDGDGKVVYLKNNETVTVYKNAYNVLWISDDGGSIWYYKSSGIYKANVNDPDAEPKVIFEDDNIKVNGCRTLDGKTFFFVTDDNTVMVVKGSGKAVKVEDYDDVGSWGVIGSKALYQKDDALYESSGSKGAKVKSFKHEVTSVYNESADIVIIKTTDGLFYTTDGKNFRQLFKTEE